MDYLEHGRTFPNQRANAGPDQSYRTFRSSSGRCAPSRHQAEGHPQVLIIAHVELATAIWVHWFNTERLHGSIGRIPPVEFESTWQAAQPATGHRASSSDGQEAA
ncbi:MAG: hypothetical protein ACOYY2_04075 [Actinomycetota bacterium]